jgi:hypothetical protein
MPRRVRELLGSWRGQLGNRNALRIWSMALLCLMWFIWLEQNSRSFDNCENGLLDLKKLMLHTLSLWRVAWTVLLVFAFYELLALCSSFSMSLGSFVYSLYIRVASLCTFMNIHYLSKKEEAKDKKYPKESVSH